MVGKLYRRVSCQIISSLLNDVLVMYRCSGAKVWEMGWLDITLHKNPVLYFLDNKVNSSFSQNELLTMSAIFSPQPPSRSSNLALG
jgi:hypothetical protein